MGAVRGRAGSQPVSHSGSIGAAEVEVEVKGWAGPRDSHCLQMLLRPGSRRWEVSDITQAGQDPRRGEGSQGRCVQVWVQGYLRIVL